MNEVLVSVIIEDVLNCPKCGGIHLDVGEWLTKPHHTHLCHHCGHLWRIETYKAGMLPDISSAAGSLRQELEAKNLMHTVKAEYFNRGYTAGFTTGLNVELVDKYQALHEDHAELVKVVEFYANRRNYIGTIGASSDIVQDGGKKARAVLDHD